MLYFRKYSKAAGAADYNMREEYTRAGSFGS